MKKIEINKLDRQETIEKLKDEGYYREAKMIERGECMNSSEMNRVNRAMSDIDKIKGIDYKERECGCEEE